MQEMIAQMQAQMKMKSDEWDTPGHQTPPPVAPGAQDHVVFIPAHHFLLSIRQLSEAALFLFIMKNRKNSFWCSNSSFVSPWHLVLRSTKLHLTTVLWGFLVAVVFTKIFVQVHVSGSTDFHSLAVEFDGFKFGFASGLNNVFTCCVRQFTIIQQPCAFSPRVSVKVCEGRILFWDLLNFSFSSTF